MIFLHASRPTEFSEAINFNDDKIKLHMKNSFYVSFKKYIFYLQCASMSTYFCVNMDRNIRMLIIIVNTENLRLV